jgi:hypothetical protein
MGAVASSSLTERISVPAALVDFLVYVVVLNLFVQFVPSVITETFSASLFTAALLLAVIEAVHRVKAPLKARVTTSSSAMGKIAGAVGLWLVLVGSKFVVLELMALVFDDRVSLGGFFSVTGLILLLMVSRALVRMVLGQPASEVIQSP